MKYEIASPERLLGISRETCNSLQPARGDALSEGAGTPKVPQEPAKGRREDPVPQSKPRIDPNKSMYDVAGHRFLIQWVVSQDTRCWIVQTVSQDTRVHGSRRARNLAQYPFVGRASETERSEIEDFLHFSWRNFSFNINKIFINIIFDLWQDCIFINF